jgi:carotenoid cleavage oxygenase
MTNRYVDGHLAPVAEETTATELTVTGTIPDHLEGRYVRNGPNPLSADPATHHWFLGEGMVHGVRLRDGRAEWYRNRWVRSAEVAGALGEPVPTGPLRDDRDWAANTHIVAHAGRLLAIVEAGARPQELSPDLDTLGPCDFDGTLPGGFTAHPKVDPATGEMHAVAYWWGWGEQVQYLVVGTDGRVRRTVDVATHGSPMMHDFSLTEHHVVLYDLPVRFDMDLAAGGIRLPYRWDPEYPARLGVMPRDGGAADVRWFEVDPCYVFHPMNAWSDGPGDQATIVLDVVRHPRMFDQDRLGPNEGPPSLHRWTVDPASGKVAEALLDDRPQEFPRIDERLTGRRHRFGYTVGAGDPADDTFAATTTVVRHDMADGRATSRKFDPGDRLSELVFVASGPTAPEEDGVLMGYIFRAGTGASSLILLDAGTLETVAEIHLPVRVPQGFHGSWIPDPT